MLVLCGCPAIARGVGDEVHLIDSLMVNKKTSLFL